jgi:predicted RNase H-like HicB family nuclease
VSSLRSRGRGPGLGNSQPFRHSHTMKRMPNSHQLRIEVEVEEDGRVLASVPELPGVMAYGETQDEAVRKVKGVALQILADMIESGEEVPDSLKTLFAA